MKYFQDRSGAIYVVSSWNIGSVVYYYNRTGEKIESEGITERESLNKSLALNTTFELSEKEFTREVMTRKLSNNSE